MSVEERGGFVACGGIPRCGGGGAGEERGEATGDVSGVAEKKRGGRSYGRKLQAEAGRLETREKIWVRSFCWRETS